MVALAQPVSSVDLHQAALSGFPARAEPYQAVASCPQVDLVESAAALSMEPNHLRLALRCVPDNVGMPPFGRPSPRRSERRPSIMGNSTENRTPAVAQVGMAAVVQAEMVGWVVVG